MTRKMYRTQCIVEDFSKNIKMYSYLSSYYEELYNTVTFDSMEWSILYKTIINNTCNEF